ncbi:MAG: sel1 repeat family protein [Alteromonadales bacterium]|nr:sel1 repeat family protein [Alteromonadales bacterium]
MGNKKRVLSIVIISILALISLVLYISNEKNKENEYLKTIVKGKFSENISIRSDARDKLSLLAKMGNAEAQYHYGEILYRENNMKKSRYFLELSSEAGVLKSTELLGLLYLDSQKVEDQLKGFNLLTKMAEKGLSISQGYLGYCFKNGECPLPKNEYLAFYWLSLAVENGEHAMRISLATLNKFEISIKKQKRETQKVICEIDPTSKGCNP